MMCFIVMLTSNSIVFTPGENPLFNCGSSSDTITSVQWLINGTRLEDLSLTNVETEFMELTDQGTLVFNNVSVEYNNTNIQCRATLSDGTTVTVDSTLRLLVQGESYKLVVATSGLFCPWSVNILSLTDCAGSYIVLCLV